MALELHLMVGDMYADELYVCTLAATPAGKQRTVDAVQRHSTRWGLSANVKKTVVMLFGNDAGSFSWDAHTCQTQRMGGLLPAVSSP